MSYYETTIRPASGGGGHFQADTQLPDAPSQYRLLGDLFADMERNAAPSYVTMLGSPDAAKRGIPDIRGRIHNEPRWVCAIVAPDGGVTYTGIAEWCPLPASGMAPR